MHKEKPVHKEKHVSSSAFITDVIIGISDGLTVPFALAAGISGATHTNALVITAGLAEIAAGSIAMGLGGFLSGQTAIEHYDAELAREYQEIERVPELEKSEVREIFASYGLSPEAQHLVTEELASDKEQWVNFMMKYELGLEKPDKNRARNSAITIGMSYIVGGIVPLLPYFFVKLPSTGLIYSSIITIICLFVFGYYKSAVTGQNPVKGAFKVTVIGALAAAAAFGIARLIAN